MDSGFLLFWVYTNKKLRKNNKIIITGKSPDLASVVVVSDVDSRVVVVVVAGVAVVISEHLGRGRPAAVFLGLLEDAGAETGS